MGDSNIKKDNSWRDKGWHFAEVLQLGVDSRKRPVELQHADQLRILKQFHELSGKYKLDGYAIRLWEQIFWDLEKDGGGSVIFRTPGRLAEELGWSLNLLAQKRKILVKHGFLVERSSGRVVQHYPALEEKSIVYWYQRVENSEN